MKRPILFFVASLCLLSCKYEPKGDYVSPIKPPTGSDTKVELNGNTTIITLPATTTFSFNVSPSGKGAYHAVITYDDQLVKTADSPTGSFTFTLSPAGHNTQGKLTIVVTYPSLSPSLAGQLGIEAIIFQQQWTVLLDTTLPPAIPAPAVAIENGKLMIRWQPPSKFNFSKLVVLKTYSNGQRDSLKVSDIHDTSLEDITYVGGDVTYRVDMKGYLYQEGATSSFTCEPMSVSLNTETGILSWPAPLLYNNSNLRLQVSGNNYSMNTGNSHNSHPRFGAYQFVAFAITPIVTNQASSATNMYQFTKKAFIGTEIPRFNEVVYVPSADAYIFYDGPTIFRLNGSLALTNIQSPPLSIYGLMLSRDEQYAYTVSSIGFDRFNPSNLAVIESTSFGALLGSIPTLSIAPSVTSGNLIAANFNGASARSYVFDMNTKTILYQSSAPDYVYLSPDGNFLIQGTTVYTRGAGNWNVLLGTLPTSEFLNDYLFRQDGVNRIYARGGTTGSIYVIDLDAPANGSNQLQFTVPTLPQNIGFSYDHHSNTLVLRTGQSYAGDLHLIDADTFAERKIISNVDWNNARVFCIKDNLLHQAGFFLPKTN